MTSDELLSTTSATTLLPVPVVRAWDEVHRLVTQLWSDQTEVLQSRTSCQLLMSVGDGCEDGVFLTWAFTPVGSGGTRVLLTCDEMASGAPEPELDAVLLALLSACPPTLAE
ncbi:MAG: hypothetical protein JWO22_2667 [Frankiales bacterium]|nr:hypothetical protein [Frankiales bacterium]